jgi:predicted transcriptional regulator
MIETTIETTIQRNQVMAAKRKAPQKAKTGKAKTKKAKPAARKPVRKAAVKRAAKKAPKKTAKPAGLVVKTDPALEARLRMLATKMNKSLDAVIAQALTEFADNWEDHMQTVAALRDTEDRVHLSVPKEEAR